MIECNVKWFIENWRNRFENGQHYALSFSQTNTKLYRSITRGGVLTDLQVELM